MNERARVAVIGPEVATELFPGESAVGKTMQVNGVNYEVVGVTKSKGSSGTQSQDDGVFAPVTAVEDTLAGYGELSSIAVEATSKDAVAEAEAQTTQVLDERHGISEGINVINQSSIIEASSSSESVFTTLLTWVAAISLLVGGIGVMNIMLVSVTERTREIGIRKAIGARRGDILAQFLSEALLVSAIGGLLGIAVGAGRQPVRNRRRAAGGRRLLGDPRRRRVARLRPLLRHLPGDAGGPPATDRGPAL